MQLAAAELDPTLDPFSVAGSFYLRQLAGSMRAAVNPAQLFYEGQKLRARATRLLEGVERTLGVRGGTGLQVDFQGAGELTAAIGLADRRIAVGLAAATAIVGTAVTASAAHSTACSSTYSGAAECPARRPPARNSGSSPGAFSGIPHGRSSVRSCTSPSRCLSGVSARRFAPSTDEAVALFPGDPVRLAPARHRSG